MQKTLLRYFPLIFSIILFIFGINFILSGAKSLYKVVTILYASQAVSTGKVISIKTERHCGRFCTVLDYVTFTFSTPEDEEFTGSEYVTTGEYMPGGNLNVLYNSENPKVSTISNRNQMYLDVVLQLPLGIGTLYLSSKYLNTFLRRKRK